MNSDWAGLLQDALRAGDDEIPEGWKTREQIASEIGKSPSHTSQLLLSTMRHGAIERRKFRVSGQAIFHYREIER